MTFLDLKPQFKIIKKNLLADFKTILKSTNFQNYSFSHKLNSKLANYSNSYAIACNSGSSALFIALKALGIGLNHQVIICSFGFKAIAKTIIATGATPVFVDLNSQNNFAINNYQIIKAINNKTKAIISVSLFGSMRNVKTLLDINKKFNIPIIEDAAQSFGAHYQNKFYSCSTFYASFTSFYPSKLLGAAGQAGALFTKDKNLFKQFYNFIHHKKLLSQNFNIDELQAAVLINKFSIFNDIINFQKQAALFYIKHLKNFNPKHLLLPNHQNGDSFSIFNIISDKRQLIINKLVNNNIPYRIYYDYLQHQLFKDFYQKQNYITNFQNSTFFKNSILAIPLYFKITKKQQINIINTIKSALNKSALKS